MSSEPRSERRQFFGGRICLDFANTVDWRLSPEPRELILDYSAFLSWSVARKTLTSSASEALSRRAASSPSSGDAEAALRAARDLRAEIWRAGDAAAKQESPPLEAVNLLIARAPAQPRLASRAEGCFYDFSGERLEEPLWPILWSFSALIASDDLNRVRCCEARGCGWLFVDTSPNRTRLWCSNEGCGNRERARRAYAKRRSP